MRLLVTPCSNKFEEVGVLGEKVLAKEFQPEEKEKKYLQTEHQTEYPILNTQASVAIARWN